MGEWMIVFVDLEHDNQREDIEGGLRSMGRRLLVKYRLEVLSGHDCLVVRYDRVDPDFLKKRDIRCLFVSGSQTDLSDYDAESLAGMKAVYRDGILPVMNFCGSFQLMAETFGVAIGPIGEDTDLHGHDGKFAGYCHEYGFCSVHVDADDPLFAGIGETAIVHQEHYWEAKSVPDGFRLTASSDLCGVQALAHASLPLYGTQFHPEYYDEAHTDGRRMIQNFLKLAGVT